MISLGAASSLAKQVWAIIEFLLPILRGLKDIIKILEEEDPDDDNKNGAKKKEIAVKIILEIYDIVDESTDDDLPIEKETLEKHLDGLIDFLVALFNAFNIFK